MLSDSEVERYARHIVLRGVGGPGQQKLNQARVVVVGAGGLGSPVLLYLAAAGVGHLRVIDDDVVSLSNLQRQVLFTTADIGRPKAQVAAEKLAALNPHVRVEARQERLDAENAAALIAGHDVAVDACDGFATRYALSDACFRARIPLVSAGITEYSGTLTTIIAHGVDAEGRPNPTWRCLFPKAPPADLAPPCAEAGVLGALPGVLGSLQALEVIKLITGAGEPLIGRLLLIDTETMAFNEARYGWRPDNPLTGKSPSAPSP
jgi:adenylyltransferase/sulfurtransferase